MKHNIFIGIDGGASKTKLIIENSAGELLGEGEGGSCNIRLSAQQSWHSIHDALSQALAQAKLDIDDHHYQFYAGLGVAGCEIKEAQTEFLSYPTPFTQMTLHSDAYIACLGAHAGHSGITISIGTGIVAYAITANKELKLSGWGFPHSDEGSGAWIGMQAVCHTTKCLDKIIEKSQLSEAILDRFDHNTDAFTTWINQAHAKEFASLAPIVIQCAKEQAPIAINIIQAANQHLSDMIQTLDKRFNTKDLPICLLGGLADHMKPHLTPSWLPRLQTSQLSPEKGAIMMIKNAILMQK